ncbi:hypothetical protein [Enterococcus casseliflavus]|uniref:DUF4760 domain-containing protein n=1 Tax=Enterococcus casseliflavus TaxID=37734 RepID=A0ABD5FJJ4_ENTCA|nr:hypothetical protein [Enterococcus casseliflavus]MDT2981869.1 hypothetical protein [Enterococcus casseliflavus]
MNLDIVSFIVGILSSIVFPLLIYVKNYIVKKGERRSFKLMINNEYIKPLVKVFDEGLSDDETKKRINRQVADILKKLDYLKTDELPFLTTDNQFYFIRVVEYTLRLLHSIVEISNSYEFRDTLPINVSGRQAEQDIFEKKIKSHINYYELNIDKYANLKTDKFQTPN